MDAAERHIGSELTAGPDQTRWLASLVRYIRHDRAVYWRTHVQQKQFTWLENEVVVVDLYDLLGYVCDNELCRGQALPWNERFHLCPFIHVPDYEKLYAEAKQFWRIRPTDRRLMRFVFCFGLFFFES